MYMRLLIFVVLVLCFPVVHLPGASSPTPDPRQEMLQAVTALQAARVLGQLNPVPATSAEAQSRMKAYDELIRRFPNEAEPHVAFGEYLTDLGANEKAFVQWTSALKIDPERHDVLAAQADLLLQTGQIVAAADALEKAVRLAPTNADYFFSLAHIYTMFRRDLIASRLSTEDALIARGTDYFRQAAELAPDNLRYAQAYAEAFYTEPKPDWVLARKAWENLLKKSTDKSLIHSHLVRVNIRLNDKSAALAHLSEMTDPAFAVMREKLQKQIDRL